jgi:hypothetical protein
MHWRVARIARRAGVGQAQSELGQRQVRLSGFGNPQKPLLGQACQPRQDDSDVPYMKEANRHVKDHGFEPPPRTKNDISHVRYSCKPDLPDQADRTRESAVFDGQAQLFEPDQTLSKVDQAWADDQAEPYNWSRTTLKPAEPTLWAECPDVSIVVEDLADEGKRVGQIARLLGLTRIEVLVILRRR